MRLRNFVLVLVFVLPLLAASAYADTPGIGTAAPFAVLGEAGVTNTGPSTIYGSVAGSSGTPSVTGFTFSTSPGPGMVIAPGVGITTGVANSGPGTPFGDATAAYIAAQAAPGAIFEGLSTLGAGGLPSLNPGVYNFSSATSLNGVLMLNAQGSSSASWVFQIGSALTVNGGSTVEIVNAGALGAFTGSITWAVGSAATFSGAPSTFLGTIISNGATPDTLTNGDTIACGRVISLNSQVTLINDTIAIPNCTVTTTTSGGGTGTGVVIPPGGSVPPPIPSPEPGTFGLLSSGLLAMVLLAFRKSRVSSPSLSC